MRSCRSSDRLRSCAFGQQRIQIERSRIHRQTAVRRAWPFFLRPIPIKFHAVAIRIAQIQCFAHAMIRGAFERNAWHLSREQASRGYPAFSTAEGGLLTGLRHGTRSAHTDCRRSRHRNAGVHGPRCQFSSRCLWQALPRTDRKTKSWKSLWGCRRRPCFASRSR